MKDIKDIKFDQKNIDLVIDKYILPNIKQYKIFSFTGPLGAGKTTIIKNILKNMGVIQLVTSPTFAYLNTYSNTNGDVFYHFDLYRIKNLQDFINSGFDEYIYQKEALIFIEWPEVIKDLLEDKDLKNKIFKINLNYDNTDFNYRILTFK